MSDMQMAVLSNGMAMPMVGLGTYRAGGGELTKAVADAIRLGYTSVDTAWFYKNEREVGQGIAESGAKRADIRITTKLWNAHQGYDSTMRAFDDSLKSLARIISICI